MRYTPEKKTQALSLALELGDVPAAAAQIGMSPATIYREMQRRGIDPPSRRSEAGDPTMDDRIEDIDYESLIDPNAPDANYPVNLDSVWPWVGYSRKADAVAALKGDSRIRPEDFSGERLKSSGGRPATAYWLTLFCAELLAMGAPGEHGRAIADYYSRKRREAEQGPKPQAIAQLDKIIEAMGAITSGVGANALAIKQTQQDVEEAKRRVEEAEARAQAAEEQAARAEAQAKTAARALEVVEAKSASAHERATQAADAAHRAAFNAARPWLQAGQCAPGSSRAPACEVMPSGVPARWVTTEALAQRWEMDPKEVGALLPRRERSPRLCVCAPHQYHSLGGWKWRFWWSEEGVARLALLAKRPHQGRLIH